MTKNVFTIHKLAVIFAMALISLSVTACGQIKETSASATKNEEVTQNGTQKEAPEPEPVITCPLDGAVIKEMPLRAMAFSIDNNGEARPQSGLDKADIVYEVPAEGGITRYLAVFFHGEAQKIGPIRSARPYLIELAREWDAVYAHCGQSPQAQAYFSAYNIAHINEILHSSGFWRDKSRKAPHNLYSSTSNLWKEIVKLGWDSKTEPEGYTFRLEGESVPGEAAGNVKIQYRNDNVGYRYDAQKGIYLRYINNSAYKDLNSGVQLSASNILIQQVSVRTIDAEGRLQIGLTGEGSAMLFSGGHVIKGIWKKDSAASRTRFYDESGSEMRMVTGQTWIQLIPALNQVTYTE
ncbi:MAG: DUF3048 domain-containing protein [Clostridiaceae bacterium]